MAEAAGNSADEVTVHVCSVPEAGAFVPPLVTVVEARSRTARRATRHPSWLVMVTVAVSGPAAEMTAVAVKTAVIAA